MSNLETAGGHPPKTLPDAPGVSLSRTEASFLEALTNPLTSCEDLYNTGTTASLDKSDVDFIREWVISRGAYWLTCENLSITRVEGTRAFRNPAVRRIINAAAEQGFCVGTCALKDEVEDYFSQRMRSPFLPEAIRDNAADKVAKLRGYYPEGSKQPGGVNVQIVVADPYAATVKEVAE
jgi:hypothetical protein